MKHISMRIYFSLQKNNPNTQFYIIIPTHSRLTYRLKDEVGDFYQWRKVIEYFVQTSEQYPNMHVYGYDDLDYADNLTNYFDLTHYNTDMNTLHFDSIANQTHILTRANITTYLDTMEQKIKNYDLSHLKELVQQKQATQ